MDDLIGDDDFFQPMAVYRRAIQIGKDGKEATTPNQIVPSPSGSIQSGANPELLRLPDMATSANMITIYTDFRLLCEGDTFGYRQNPEALAQTDAFGNQITPFGSGKVKADIVVYHGTPFEVFLVQDWTDYGAGFIAAVARQISSAQAAI